MTNPVAEVIAIRNYSGLRGVRILCPFCGRTELQPWPASRKEPGTFPAHCQRGDYVIETPTTKGTPA